MTVIAQRYLIFVTIRDVIVAGITILNGETLTINYRSNARYRVKKMKTLLTLTKPTGRESLLRLESSMFAVLPKT
jgi:hypothetical protein